MRVRPLVALATVLALALPSFVAAQSMAEAAAKEKERRKGKPAPKVITDEDLKRAGQGRYAPAEVTGTEGSETTTEAAKAVDGDKAVAGKPKEKTEDEVRAEQEKAWQDKLKNANAGVERLAADVDRLQAAANDMTGNLYGSARANLLSQLEAAKQKLAAAQQQVADLQEEGRRNRFRP